MNSRQKKWATHLVNEAGKAVVEGLDLLFLLGTDSLDVGVDLEVQRGQQARVDLDICDGSHTTSKTATATSTETTSKTATATHA